MEQILVYGAVFRICIQLNPDPDQKWSKNKCITLVMQHMSTFLYFSFLQK